VEITEEGFVRIVGRLKRFSKISGEMISLTAVEEALTGEFDDRKELAIVAVPDEQKGERLVVVTNNSKVDLKAIRHVLKAKGFSDLATPRGIRHLKELPKLGTGKIDYVKLMEFV
jgi:acyl-[acyl-carrier-protein]-phospholipid O-acyltransferase / long-chain-fatty-acid--[acyl-carrier-protein] ligase